jgi:hypothetical protein
MMIAPLPITTRNIEATAEPITETLIIPTVIRQAQVTPILMEIKKVLTGTVRNVRTFVAAKS